MTGSVRRATLAGTVSIGLWSTLALLTRLAGNIPPFQLLAMTFSIAFILMLSKWLWCRQSLSMVLRQPWPVWLLGVGGLFGYHLFYFIALANAPVVEASLIAYLWPLLIVLLSSLLPGNRLQLRHLGGALLAFFGVWLLLGRGSGFQVAYLPGYLAAAVCALIWSGYSVLSRLVSQVPTDAVGGFCGVTAILGLISHALWETTVWPLDAVQWLGVIGLGLGPMGLAFFTWDYAVKHGNLQLLGVLAYAAPLLSTLLLVLVGMVEPGMNLLFSSLAISGAALFASLGLPARRRAGN
ncbi:MAG TPA: EamA family transporter [Gammaproteobacteria bacterium]|nr:EamA family transporter [Gammaproteobacteria bacterium]